MAALDAQRQSMKWLKSNLGVCLTAITLLIAAGLAFGRLDARQESLSRQLAAKVDREPLLRELDLVHDELRKIDQRLDGVIIRQAIVADQ
jgi:hypothetical protein